MEPEWQNDYDGLYDSFKNLNLCGARMQFTQTYGLCVDGKIAGCSFDKQNNCFISLEDVTIEGEHFPRCNIMGANVLVWRISPTETRNDRSTLATSESNNNSIGKQQMTVTTSEIRVAKESKRTLSWLKKIAKPKQEELDEVDDVLFDSETLSLPFANDIQLIRALTGPKCESKREAIHHFEICQDIVTQLKSEKQIGFCVLPSVEAARSPSNHVIESLSRPAKTRLWNFTDKYSVPATLYLCFSCASSNYAFQITDQPNVHTDKVVELLGEVLQSTDVCKIIHDVEVCSGLLAERFNIRLENVSDLTTLDRHIVPTHAVINASDMSWMLARNVKTIEQLAQTYLNVIIPPCAVRPIDWRRDSIPMLNVIRVNIIFLRELFFRMNYKSVYSAFLFSKRSLDCLRSASAEEMQVFSKLGAPTVSIYEEILRPRYFDSEVEALDSDPLRLGPTFPLHYRHRGRFLTIAKKDNAE